MRRVRTGLFGLLLGAICGGLSGASIFGVLVYFDDSWSMLGSSRDWTFIAILMGLVFGGAVGGILGVLIGASQVDRRSGVIIGTAAGLLIAASQFTGGENTYISASDGLYALGAVVYCEILGLAIAHVLMKRYQGYVDRNYS